MSTAGGPENWFSLRDRVVVVTGGLGLLGRHHADAIVAAGGVAVLADLARPPAGHPAAAWLAAAGDRVAVVEADITNPADVDRLRDEVLGRFGRVDALVNNAANNPKVEDGLGAARLEDFPLAVWDRDIAVGLTGAFLCSRVLGAVMAARGGGAIVNVASDLAVIAPDQRLYREPGLPANRQPVKPVTYSVVKTALLGLTRYLATYWADAGVRVNAISPGGVYNGQPDAFVRRLADLIPLGRMARADEYQGAIVFLCSDASSYMTGANLVIDGGRTCW